MIGIGIGLDLGLLGGAGNPASYALYPAPAGYRWDFVTENSVRVTENAIPVVELVAA